MGKTLDLGRRIELNPLDQHCHDISMGLYQRDVGGVPQLLVHSYSSNADVPQRVAFIRQALVTMAGMEPVPNDEQRLQFSCRTMHTRAIRRAFLDLCKLDTNSPLDPKPLIQFDKKADSNLTVRHLGRGVYQIDGEQGVEVGPRRAVALARGYTKICEAEPVAAAKNQIALPCQSGHDTLMALMMFRAQNVRASMQEDESTSSRGVLSSPSQQK